MSGNETSVKSTSGQNKRTNPFARTRNRQLKKGEKGNERAWGSEKLPFGSASAQ